MDWSSQRDVERRSSERFEFRTEIAYRATLSKSKKIVGVGKTINLSSEGILFQAPDKLLIGSKIELFIKWPAMLDSQHILCLCATGVTTRIGGGKVAAQIRRIQFRVRRTEARSNTICFAFKRGRQSKETQN